MRSPLLSLRLRQPTPFRYLTSAKKDPLRESLCRRKFPVEYDKSDSQALQLLQSSLQDFLPPRPESWQSGRALFPGHHLVYFPPAVPENVLLPDGTDLLHAPNPSYKYRLWAGGDVSYPHPSPHMTDTHQDILLKQEIVDVKTKSAQEGKIWMKIQRRIYTAWTETERSKSVKEKPDLPIVVENRWLAFYKVKPTVNLDNGTPPPAEVYYSHSMRTTSALLFRFSALTFNAHAVHIDPEYTKKEYGLPDLLVHGPLTFVLMMEVLVRGLDQHEREHGLDQHAWTISKVEYRNIMPVFVGEEITTCCVQTKGPIAEDYDTHLQVYKAGREERQWEVWVQKMVDGQPSMCVKATAVVVKSVDVPPRPKHARATDSPP